jgi:hypothetical protein
VPYDPNKPWVTHFSCQNGAAVAELGRVPIYRQMVRKPCVFDEVRYEGNLEKRWGNLSGQEMVLRFWVGTIGGAYVGHGESLLEGDEPAWLSRGGVFRGTSPPRIKFLRDVLATAPPDGIDPIDQYYESDIAGKAGHYYLIYFGRQRPAEWTFALYKDHLADGMRFHVDVIDTWDMTVAPIAEPFTLERRDNYMFGARGGGKVPLPGKPYMALRIVRLGDGPTTATTGTGTTTTPARTAAPATRPAEELPEQ